MVHGRMFAPAIGIEEDPVTGNANGPLGAYLVHCGLVRHNGALLSFQVVQGEANRADGRNGGTGGNQRRSAHGSENSWARGDRVCLGADPVVSSPAFSQA